MKPVPFAEAIAWAVARKVVLPEVYYGEMQGVARSLSFSIAGVAQLSQLQAVLDSLVKETTASSFGEWKAAVARGDIDLDLPAHRLENIYRTNLQSHYNRGRCEQQRRVVDVFPYYMYDAVNDSRTRPSHAAMDGFVARADDPVWGTWTPPNGYMCRCRRIALTEKQAQRYLDKPLRPEQEAARRDALLNGPDPGWDYSVCKDISKGAGAAGDTLRLDPALAAVKKDPPPMPIKSGLEDPRMQAILARMKTDKAYAFGYGGAGGVGQDEVLADILRATGGDGAPRVVKSLPGAGLFRGVAREEQAEQFRSGTLYVGRGMYGSGTYATPDESFAKNYGAAVLRMQLDPSARTITKAEIAPRLYADYLLNKELLGDDLAHSFTDFGRWAAMNNYDAIIIDAAEVLILNRTKVIVEAAAQ